MDKRSFVVGSTESFDSLAGDGDPQLSCNHAWFALQQRTLHIFLTFAAITIA